MNSKQSTVSSEQYRGGLLPLFAALLLIVLLCSATVSAAQVKATQPGRTTISKATITNWEPSPDGRMIVLTLVNHDAVEQAWQGWVCIADLGQGHAVPRKTIYNAYAAQWSPSGKEIVYTNRVKMVAYPPAESDIRVSLYSLLTRASTNVTSGHNDQAAAWSSDGKAIVFARALLPGPGVQIQATSKRGGGWTPLQSVGSVYPAISAISWRPGSNEVAYRGNKLKRFFSLKGQHTWIDLYTLDARTGATHQLTRTGDVSSFARPEWSPDGRYLAYARETPYLMNKPGYGGMFQTLEVMDVHSRKRSVIVKASSLGGKPLRVDHMRWSPDGKWIVFDALTLDKAAKTNIALVELPDGKFRWLTRDGKSKLPRWSGNGRTVMYMHANKDIWSVNTNGSGEHKVYDLASCLAHG